ncbi:unnamed protein product [Medioppia subpectinata]|uniref:glutathione transferase n=1 Tax=Medioppia subpectinata TaxID=1979941 RepID=A0A7R9LL28_9ACAR|nr:unnamed protein product [Medioppia subpectinata]CAG2119758.1 unnamed protein product [Medioppia subpectinata]
MRHLARKHGLVATDETGLTRQDVLEQQLEDIRSGFVDGLVFGKDYKLENIKYIAETLPQQLDALSRFLDTRQWFTVGYFKMRGRAQPIRLLLAYKGVNFTDKYYDPPGADTPESYRVEWRKQ